MARMLDLIRAAAVSQHQMMSAARGALRVPTEEMLEILVYIAEHSKIFGEQARFTLAGWDEPSAKAIAANPNTPKEILDYWVAPKNIRTTLFALLLENPSVEMTKLGELASASKGELIDLMIASPRVRNSRQVLNDLGGNHNLTGAQAARVQALIEGRDYVEPEAEQQAAPPETQALPSSVPQPAPNIKPIEAVDPETEKAVSSFITEHAAEIAAEGDKPFQAIGGLHEAEVHAEATAESTAILPAPSTPPALAPAGTSTGAAAVAKPALDNKAPVRKVHVDPQNELRGSVLQKIGKLDIKGRIQLAMKGTKEERSILVRDGTKIVALAVLDSPKISDGEVEKFATQKNVLEAVLRSIPMKRRFAKNYAVVRNLVFNPRTPLDVSLGLMKNMLTADLKNLAGNKEVSETIRKLALRMFKQKSEPGKG
ncbi:MAG TPA: hypothetical protein VL156_19290 [Terriglobales bacterium]|jgi:hypothetical protein|nr:hypothetical protein [Terriglobales bacterium]